MRPAVHQLHQVRPLRRASLSVRLGLKALDASSLPTMFRQVHVRDVFCGLGRLLHQSPGAPRLRLFYVDPSIKKRTTASPMWPDTQKIEILSGLFSYNNITTDSY